MEMEHLVQIADEISSLTAKKLRELIPILEKHYAVTAALSKQREQVGCSVIVKEIGDYPDETARVVSYYTLTTPQQAAERLQTLPALILESVSNRDASLLCEELSMAGASSVLQGKDYKTDFAAVRRQEETPEPAEAPEEEKPVVTQPPQSEPPKAEPIVTYDVMLSAVGSSKLNVIKVIREVTGMGLKDAKALVEACPQYVKTDVQKSEADSISQRLRNVGASVEVISDAEAPADDGTHHQVTLIQCGSTKLAVIKIIKEATGLSLKEAKALAETEHAVIKSGLDRNSAESLAAELRDAGAEVTVTEGGS